jgi:hypothetical protein
MCRGLRGNLYVASALLAAGLRVSTRARAWSTRVLSRATLPMCCQCDGALGFCAHLLRSASGNNFVRCGCSEAHESLKWLWKSFPLILWWCRPVLELLVLRSCGTLAADDRLVAPISPLSGSLLEMPHVGGSRTFLTSSLSCPDQVAFCGAIDASFLISSFSMVIRNLCSSSWKLNV